MNNYQINKLISFINLRDELIEHEANGMSLALEGKDASADEIAKACIFREESSYMRDYISGKTQNTLNFNKIRYR